MTNNDTPAERDAIVRWLREKVTDFREQANERLGRQAAHYLPIATHYEMVANAIERGDHLKEIQHGG